MLLLALLACPVAESPPLGCLVRAEQVEVYGLSLDIDEAGVPRVSWVTAQRQVKLATGRDGVWSVQTVANDGDFGRTAVLSRDGRTTVIFGHGDVEALIQAGRAGLPVHACSLPSAGGTAPLSVAGNVLMAVAEILAMVTMGDALAPGLPIIATPLTRATRRASLRSWAPSARRSCHPQTTFNPAEASTISPQTSPTTGGAGYHDGTGASSGAKKSTTSCAPP